MDTKQQLDAILENYLDASEIFSTIVKEELEIYKECLVEHGKGTQSLSQLATAAERITRTLVIITELAPFFQTKLQVEGAEGMREWLHEQPEFVGEIRQHIIDAIDAYQKELLENTGHISLSGQGVLL